MVAVPAILSQPRTRADVWRLFSEQPTAVTKSVSRASIPFRRTTPCGAALLDLSLGRFVSHAIQIRKRSAVDCDRLAIHRNGGKARGNRERFFASRACHKVAAKTMVGHEKLASFGFAKMPGKALISNRRCGICRQFSGTCARILRALPVVSVRQKNRAAFPPPLKVARNDSRKSREKIALTVFPSNG